MSSRSTILADQLQQTAVWWANPVLDGFGGRTFDHGVDIRCRWEQKQELFVDAQGQRVLSRAVAYVDRDLSVHDYLYLGTLEDLVTVGIQPFEVAEAFEVRAFKKIPSRDATRFVRTAWL
jgi:hypothetical protein